MPERHARALKTGQLRADLICSGLQTGELVGAGFIAEGCIDDTGCDVCRGYRYTGNEGTRRIGNCAAEGRITRLGKRVR